MPSSVNPFVPIDASYGGDSNNIGSSGSFSLTKATTTILVDCATNLVTVGSNTLCTATVSGNFGSLVGDTIFFASSGAGSFTPGATCTISSGTGCSDTYTPSSVGSGTHTITASFSGDGYNAGSSGSFSLSVSENYTILIVGVVVVVIIVAILAFVFWRRRGHRPTGPPSG